MEGMNTHKWFDFYLLEGQKPFKSVEFWGGKGLDNKLMIFVNNPHMYKLPNIIVIRSTYPTTEIPCILKIH